MKLVKYMFSSVIIILTTFKAYFLARIQYIINGKQNKLIFINEFLWVLFNLYLALKPALYDRQVGSVLVVRIRSHFPRCVSHFV